MSEQKFLNQEGVQYLWSQLSMEDYPNNETLITVINAIDETKADKIKGTIGQIIGFNSYGEMIAQDLPTFVTLKTWTLNDIL